jgi:hypothetical protein
MGVFMKQTLGSNDLKIALADGLDAPLDIDPLTDEELNAVGGGAFPFIQT